MSMQEHPSDNGNPPLGAITYHAAAKYVSQKLRDTGIAEDVIANRVSSLKRCLEVNGLSLDHPVGIEFGPGWEGMIDTYAATMKEGSNSRNNARSQLRQWKKWILEFQTLIGLPPEFTPALVALIEKSGKPVKELAPKVGLSPQTIWSWCRGGHSGRGIVPHLGVLPAIQKLEAELGVPPGTLANRLPHMRCPRAVKGEPTEYAEKIVALQNKPFRMKFGPIEGEDPAKIRFPRWHAFFTKLCTFKTTLFLPPGIGRNKPWRALNGACPTAERARATLERILGWMLLPRDAQDPQMRGLGLSEEETSPMLICDPETCKGFLSFAEARAGCHTQDSIWLIDFLISLLQPKVGFLYQHPEYAAEPGMAKLLPTFRVLDDDDTRIPISGPKRWTTWCRNCIKELQFIRRNLRPNLRMGRDPHKMLKPILDLKRPMLALFDLAARMEANIPGSTYAKRVIATAYRDLLLLSMLIACPLRIKMFSIMKYRADGSGNLSKREDGWYLSYEPHEFKNTAHAAKDPYDVPLPAHLYDLIEEYLFNQRKHLVGADQSDYVFLRSSQGRPVDVAGPTKPAILSEAIRAASRQFLPHFPQFAAHAIRHIVATDLVKSDPVGGLQRAADALVDRIETIRDVYGRYLIKDKYKVWMNHYESRRTEALGDDAGKDDHGKGRKNRKEERE